MFFVLKTSQYHALPYSNWLTLVFKHFRVDFSGEVRNKASIPKLRRATFKYLGVFKIPSGRLSINYEMPT